jgi:hypothetical protein
MDKVNILIYFICLFIKVMSKITLERKTSVKVAVDTSWMVPGKPD